MLRIKKNNHTFQCNKFRLRWWWWLQLEWKILWKKYSFTDNCLGPRDNPLREVLIPVCQWAHWKRFRGFCKVTQWVCQPLTRGFRNLCSQSLSDSLFCLASRIALGHLDLEKNYASEEQLPLTPKLLQLSLCSLLISSHFPRWSEKEMIGEIITLETLTHALSFLSYTLWHLCFCSGARATPLQPRCDDPSAEDQCHSMKRLLFFLNQLILLWDPQIHLLMISALCFEFSVAQKQFPAECLSAPIDIVVHWTGLKFPSFLQRPGAALPCDSQIRRVQIYLFQIYLFRWPLCFYSVN